MKKIPEVVSWKCIAQVCPVHSRTVVCVCVKNTSALWALSRQRGSSFSAAFCEPLAWSEEAVTTAHLADARTKYR